MPGRRHRKGHHGNNERLPGPPISRDTQTTYIYWPSRNEQPTLRASLESDPAQLGARVIDQTHDARSEGTQGATRSSV